MHLAANVRRHRVERGLTQEALAGLAGLEARYVQRIEATAANPTVTVLAALAGALNVDIRALFEPAEPEPRRVGRPSAD